MRPLAIDVFWSFRSPYSYLATPRLVRLAAEYLLDVRVRVVLPIAVRDPDFFQRVNPLWPPYLLCDTTRIAEREGIPYGWPRPDPIVQEFPSRRIAAEQPYIHRLTRLGVEATRRGRGLPFIDAVSQLIWSGTVDGWHQGSHLADAAHPADRDAEVVGNQEALAAAGHWGVPTMVFAGEPFFGQDRIDTLVWRLQQHGLSWR
jgi:2-hydroxychromene-2-carboxylate isomerase